MILAQNIDNLFGKVTPPPGLYNTAPVAGLGNLLTVGIQLFLLVTSFVFLLYLLWGGYDWIQSSGEREKLDKAKDKMTNAALGLLIVVASLTVFTYVVGNLFGIIRFDKGFSFTLPTLQDVAAPTKPPSRRGPGPI